MIKTFNDDLMTVIKKKICFYFKSVLEIFIDCTDNSIGTIRYYKRCFERQTLTYILVSNVGNSGCT